MAVYIRRRLMYNRFGHLIKKRIVTGYEGLDKHNYSLKANSLLWGKEFRILNALYLPSLFMKGD